MKILNEFSVPCRIHQMMQKMPYGRYISESRYASLIVGSKVLFGKDTIFMI